MTPETETQQNMTRLCYCLEDAVCILYPMFLDSEGKPKVHEGIQRNACSNYLEIAKRLNYKFINLDGYYGVAIKDIKTGKVEEYPREKLGEPSFEFLRCW